MKNAQKIAKNQRGISLPEIMAGITIMTILTGVGVKSAVNQINDAHITATMEEMKGISEAVSEYHRVNPGSTISTISTLVSKGYLAEGFTDAPDSDLETDWSEDSWGGDYKITPPIVEADGDYMRGSLESAGTDGIFADDPVTTGLDESDDNIKITLEPMVAGN